MVWVESYQVSFAEKSRRRLVRSGIARKVADSVVTLRPQDFIGLKYEPRSPSRAATGAFMVLVLQVAPTMSRLSIGASERVHRVPKSHMSGGMSAVTNAAKSNCAVSCQANGAAGVAAPVSWVIATTDPRFYAVTANKEQKGPSNIAQDSPVCGGCRLRSGALRKIVFSGISAPAHAGKERYCCRPAHLESLIPPAQANGSIVVILTNSSSVERDAACRCAGTDGPLGGPRSLTASKNREHVKNTAEAL